MNTVLPLRVQLLPAETPASFASRMADANAIEYAADFCLDMGCRLQDVADGEPSALKLIGATGGLDFSDLQRFAVERTDAGQYLVAGQLLEKRWIQRAKLRFCPTCVSDDLQESGHHGAALKAYWHVPFIRTCHAHSMPLFEIDAISHARGPHDFSGRLRDLQLTPTTLRKYVSYRAVSPLEQYLVRRIDGKRQNRWLDRIPFNAVAMTSEALGIVLEFGNTRNVRSLSETERLLAGTLGYSVLSQGRFATQRALRDLNKRAGSPVWFQRRSYGYLFNWLEQSKAEQYEPIRKLMRDHIVSTYPVGEGDMVLGQPCAKRQVHSLATAKAEFGIDPQKLRCILNGAGLLPRDDASGKFKTDILFKVDEILPILTPFKDSICQLATRKRINAPRAQFDVLLAHKFIRGIPGSGDGLPSYSIAETDDFLQQLLGRAVTIDTPSESYVDIQTACRKTVCGAADVVALIISGRLAFVGRNPKEEGYLSVLVDPKEVGELLQLSAPKGYMKHEIASFLGVNDPAVKFLTTSGVLPVVKSRHPVSRKAISIVSFADMKLFLGTYLPCRHLANELGKNTRWLGNKFARDGVSKIEMPPGCRGTIFKRTRVLDAYVEGLCPSPDRALDSSIMRPLLETLEKKK